MVGENQNIEYKESWRDEYLKWICGFANAQGGCLYIGIDDDKQVIGLTETEIHRLSEDVPNKVRDILGITVDVNILCDQEHRQYLEIAVPAYSNPINYKGQYHYRSGSTKQELKGPALNKFLLDKSGIGWDEYVVPNVYVSDLSAGAIERFRKHAAENHRVDKDILDDSDEVLLDNLRLIDKATRQVKRAGVMMFHADPEEFVRGAYVKLGFFAGDDDELVFQDEVHGPLILQADNIVKLLLERYLVYAISYEGTHRRERIQYPEDALREGILNALTHKDYTSGTPIQISVYPNFLMIWNPGHLPQSWTIAHLFEKHSSDPFNPGLANVYFRAGDIESWGRGFRRICRAMDAIKLLPPIVSTEGGLTITYYNKPDAQMVKMGLDGRQMNILKHILEHGKITNANVQEMFKVSRPTALRLLSGMKDIIDLVGGKGVDSYYVIRIP